MHWTIDLDASIIRMHEMQIYCIRKHRHHPCLDNSLLPLLHLCLPVLFSGIHQCLDTTALTASFATIIDLGFRLKKTSVTSSKMPVSWILAKQKPGFSFNLHNHDTITHGNRLLHTRCVSTFQSLNPSTSNTRSWWYFRTETGVEFRDLIPFSGISVSLQPTFLSVTSSVTIAQRHSLPRSILSSFHL